MAKKRIVKSLSNLESLYGFGENPKGMTAETPNGTSHATGTGWNRDRPWNMEEIYPDGPWPAGRSNRTGE